MSLDILSLLGTAAGGFFGGPLGAAAGGTIGGALSGHPQQGLATGIGGAGIGGLLGLLGGGPPAGIVSGAGVPWQLGNITKTYGGGSAGLSGILGLLGNRQSSASPSGGRTSMYRSTPVPPPISVQAMATPLGTSGADEHFEAWAQQTYGQGWRNQHREQDVLRQYQMQSQPKYSMIPQNALAMHPSQYQ